jgi:hypothetical protein
MEPTRIYEIRQVTATIDFRSSPSNRPCPILLEVEICADAPSMCATSSRCLSSSEQGVVDLLTVKRLGLQEKKYKY